MSELRLWLISGTSPSLERIEFYNSAIAETRCLFRGNSSRVVPGAASLHWSPAVRALTLLALRTKAASTVGPFSLSGGERSPAASLDYAITKRPAWLCELFGWSADGTAHAPHYFRRTNSERKHAGPVLVGLNPARLPSGSLFVSFDGHPVEDCSALGRIADAIEHQSDVTADIRETFPRPFDTPEGHKALTEMFRKEIHTSLRSTDIFGASSLLVRAIAKHPSFAKIANGKIGVLSPLNKPLPTSAKLGLVRQLPLFQEEPLSIASCPATAGANALFTYLTEIRSERLEIDNHYPHSVEIVDRILRGDIAPDLCVMGIAPAATLIRRSKDYAPIMLLPAITQRIVSTSTRRGLEAGRFCFVGDRPSAASFYFDDLIRSGTVKPRRSKREYCEPDEAACLLKEHDDSLRAILWFPFYGLHERFNGCALLDSDPQPLHCRMTMLFARKEIIRESSRVLPLIAKLRDAWLELREGGQPFERVLQSAMGDRAFLTTVKRCGGLHHYF